MAGFTQLLSRAGQRVPSRIVGTHGVVSRRHGNGSGRSRGTVPVDPAAGQLGGRNGPQWTIMALLARTAGRITAARPAHPATSGVPHPDSAPEGARGTRDGTHGSLGTVVSHGTVSRAVCIPQACRDAVLAGGTRSGCSGSRWTEVARRTLSRALKGPVVEEHVYRGGLQGGRALEIGASRGPGGGWGVGGWGGQPGCGGGRFLRGRDRRGQGGSPHRGLGRPPGRHPAHRGRGRRRGRRSASLCQVHVRHIHPVCEQSARIAIGSQRTGDS
mmetsp:Transcript_25213/g.34685  ORF Transcript_25213/g.34685 Transcript_25213/m.34685 type:complete len:272 (-) Transcript_25213:3071-3886(-)